MCPTGSSTGQADPIDDLRTTRKAYCTRLVQINDMAINHANTPVPQYVADMYLQETFVWKQKMDDNYLSLCLAKPADLDQDTTTYQKNLAEITKLQVILKGIVDGYNPNGSQQANSGGGMNNPPPQHGVRLPKL